MIFTTEMIQLFAVVLAKDCEPVTEALLREGVMQFINISELESEKLESLSEFKSNISLTKISDLRKRIEGFLFAGGVVPPAPQETDLNRRTVVNIEKENAVLDKIAGQFESIRERQRTLQQEIHKLEDIKRQIELYGIGISDVAIPAKYSFIAVQIGKLPVANVKQFDEALRDLPSLNLTLGQEDDMSHHLLISMKRDNEQINKILSKVGWSKVELPGELRAVKKDIFNELTTKLQTLVEEQKKAEVKVHDLMKKEQRHLSEIWTNLRINELLLNIQENFKSSSRTVIFTGWLPSSKKERLTQKIRQACEDRCYLEWNRAGSMGVIGEETPVRFNNPKVFAPFQMLVSNFGTPQYGTIDPTPFVMPLYLAMFGLMFADVGHGFVLTLVGLSGIFHFRKKEDQTGWYQFSWLILWCSLSAILFGILFGSYFGFGLFKPLWFDYHGIVSGHTQHDSAFQDISDILAITIYFGIFVIVLGLSFNWINLVRKQEWMELIFDKGGFLGGWIYCGGVYVIYHMVSKNSNGPLPGRLIFLLVGLPALLLFIKEPYHFFKHKKEQSDQKLGPAAILNLFMVWLVELLEIFGGYLSNTLSFMRVAALGIAHVALMITFFDIAKMAPVWGSIIILILGNLLVIGLEGLSAGIQALRLNYYEFFTKFFHGTGKLYTPISLSSKYR